MTDLSCKCLCPPSSCFSRSSHSVYPPTVSDLADSRPHPPSSSPVDAAEPPRILVEGVDTSVEEKADAPIKTDETRQRELSMDENGDVNTNDIDCENEPQALIPLKSSLKKPSSAENTRKGRVKWTDILGNDLVQVREFEASDSEDINGEHSLADSCGCVIQ